MGDLRSATSFSRTLLHYDIPSQSNAGSVSSKHPPLIPPPAPAKTISISKVIDHKELCRSSININITNNNKEDMLDKGGGGGEGACENRQKYVKTGDPLYKQYSTLVSPTVLISTLSRMGTYNARHPGKINSAVIVK